MDVFFNETMFVTGVGQQQCWKEAQLDEFCLSKSNATETASPTCTYNSTHTCLDVRTSTVLPPPLPSSRSQS